MRSGTVHLEIRIRDKSTTVLDVVGHRIVFDHANSQPVFYDPSQFVYRPFRYASFGDFPRKVTEMYPPVEDEFTPLHPSWTGPGPSNVAFSHYSAARSRQANRGVFLTQRPASAQASRCREAAAMRARRLEASLLVRRREKNREWRRAGANAAANSRRASNAAGPSRS